MLDFMVIGPIITAFAAVDIALHLWLDLKKVKNQKNARFSEPSYVVPWYAILLVVVGTFLLFAFVFLFMITWIWLGTGALVSIFSPIILPDWVGMFGLVILVSGVSLHGWSRYVRQEMATSWIMSNTHVLIKDGPYSVIRHPSYMSYMMCALGIIFILPSLLSLLTFLVFPGYYLVATFEERYLLATFGDEYLRYMTRTGRFLPKINHSQD
jgi:protein-S-isoprenylcysteine O-methyltransferase Ste14